jgi:hypothetical protein
MRNVELMFEPDSRLGDGAANGLSSSGTPEKISYYFSPARTQQITTLKNTSMNYAMDLTYRFS